MQNKKCLFTGGGSGGHVIPAKAILSELLKSEPFASSRFQLFYVGSYQGIERSIISSLGISYRGISTGKLRRSLRGRDLLLNVVDWGRVLWGFFQCLCLMLRERPTLVVSMGGFVSVPVVLAAFILRVPIVIHEQTTRAGLANRIAGFLAQRVLLSFESSGRFFPRKKSLVLGYPLREEVVSGEVLENPPWEGRSLLFVTGGGNGSALLNGFVFEHLERPLASFFVLHQTGKRDFPRAQGLLREGYLPRDFLGGAEYATALRGAHLVVSRAGAGTVSELLFLGKKSLFVPLKGAQGGEQLCNARWAQEKLGSLILGEEEFLEKGLEVIEKFSPGVPSPQGGVNPSKRIVQEILSFL